MGLSIKVFRREPKPPDLVPSWPTLFQWEGVALSITLCFIVMVSLFVPVPEGFDPSSLLIRPFLKLSRYFDPLWVYLIFPFLSFLSLLIPPLTENRLLKELPAGEKGVGIFTSSLLLLPLLILLYLLSPLPLPDIDSGAACGCISFPSAGPPPPFLLHYLPLILYPAIGAILPHLLIRGAKGVGAILLSLQGLLFSLLLLLPLKIALIPVIPCRYLIDTPLFRF